MILINKEYEKEYGVIHQLNLYHFVGFFKNLENVKSQDIDVYINKQKIDTISPNLRNKHLESIYDLEDNVCFDYILEDKYISNKIVLEFRSHNTSKALENSPIKIINDDFKYYIFNNNLNKPIEKDKIQNLYSKNCIGFLATEENMKNITFINYIKKLSKILPFLKFKVFYFTAEQKKRIEEIYIKELHKFEFNTPVNLYDIVHNIEVFLDIDGMIMENLSKGLIKYNKNIILILYPPSKDLEIIKLNKLARVNTEKYNVLKELGIKESTIKKSNSKFIISAWENFFISNNINYRFNHEMNIGEFFIEILKLSFKYPECKKHLVKMNYLYYKMNLL